MSAAVSQVAAPRPREARGAIGHLERVLPALVVLLAAVFALRRLDNNDTWWHLAGGRWIVTHGFVPSHDPLSWTVRDHAWTNVQWLFDVVMYGLFQLGGASLLVVTSAIAYSGATALFLVNLRRHLDPVPTALLGAWAVLIAQNRFAIRPEMFSFLLVQVILWLYATGRAPERKRLWFLPAVMCLFANCHSLFVVGEVVIVAHMAGVLLSNAPVLPPGLRRPVDPRVRKRVLVTGAAALLATVVNPFGIKGALFPFVLISRINGQYPFFRTIGEFKRPFEDYFVTYSVQAYRLFFYFAIATVVVGLLLTSFRTRPPGGRRAMGARRAARRRRRIEKHQKGAASPAPPEPTEQVHRIDIADVAVFVGVAYLSTLARRNIALFALVAGPSVAACLAVIAAYVRASAPVLTARLRRAIAVVLAPAILASCWFVASNGFYRENDEFHEFGLGTIPMYFPIRAAEFIKTQKLPGPLFNDFSSGGYFSWAQPIAGGVYVDGRTEVYDVEFLRPYMRYVQRPDEWQAEMDRRGVQTVSLFHWWPNHQALVRYLGRDSRWAVVYYDETSVVAVRREGNSDAIARAEAAFEPERVKTETMLLESRRSWQWPVARARGNTTYATVLAALRKGGEARRFREEAARLSPRRG